MKSFPTKRLLAGMTAIGAITMLGVAAFALTAANSGNAAASAGQNSTTVSGYALSGLTYTPNGSNPENLDAVNFSILPITSGTVKVKANNGVWYACTNAGQAGNIVCDTTVGTQLTTLGVTSIENVVIQ